MDLLHPLAGFVVGVLVGLTGVGGGALLTPLLVFFFGTAPQVAIGTDLLFAAVTKGAGTAAYLRHGSIDWVVLRRLATGSLPASLLTLWAIGHFSTAESLKSLLMIGLGCALVLTSVVLFLQPRLHRLGKRLRTTSPTRFMRMQPGLTIVAGAALGFLVTFTSVGAGALGVVVLTYLYPLRLTPAKLVGTDIAHAVPLTLVAGIGHWGLGNVDFGLLGALLLGSIPGILLGSRLSVRLDHSSVRLAIAAILAIVGGKLVFAF